MTGLLTHRTVSFHEVDGVRTHRNRLFIDFRRPGPRVAICGVNPSKADGDKNDPTMAKVCGFSERLGWGQVDMVNKATAISTDVRGLKTHPDPIGPWADDFLDDAFSSADVVIFAWGPLAKLPPALRGRWRAVVKILSEARPAPLMPMCWGVCNDGHPRHPLMLAYATKLRPWEIPQ